MNDKISVIIPTYKRSTFLERAIKSVLNQTYKNFEILIIDDNLKDSLERKETEEILKNYLKLENVTYIKNQENIGGALSRNVGIENAKGKYIAFLDDDDEYYPNKLERQINFYNSKFKNGKKGIIYCQSKILNDKGEIVKSSKKIVNGNKEAKYEILKGGFTSTGCIFLTKDLLQKVGGFEKLMCGQEWYLILKILSKGYECYCQNEELLLYYVHSQERISNNSNKKIKGEKYLYEIKKNYIKELPILDQKELHYLNNMELARLNFNFKNKKEGRKYIAEAKKYKNIKTKDILKLEIGYYLTPELKRKIKKIINKFCSI